MQQPESSVAGPPDTPGCIKQKRSCNMDLRQEVSHLSGDKPVWGLTHGHLALQKLQQKSGCQQDAYQPSREAWSLIDLLHNNICILHMSSCTAGAVDQSNFTPSASLQAT